MRGTTMRVYRFDEEVGVPRRPGGVGLRVSHLVGHGSLTTVEVLHLAAGGLVSLDGAPQRQFVGVLTGVARAVQNGVDRELLPYHGVLLEPGESLELHSEAGLTGIRIEGDFEPGVMAVTQEIIVQDYDPEWPSWFGQLRERLWPTVAPVAVRIDHVGSTSVPGLAAKPIIDMDIVVSSPRAVELAIQRLEGIGYRWRGDLGVPGREAFSPPPEGADPRHHLYVVVENNKAHLDHWLLRDLLRSDADARRRYATLKKRNQELAGGDIDYYVAAKAALVAELLTRARAERGFPAATYWDPDIARFTPS
jgi:GrpB-like predicted nucleotidyltransferase (UPF0157 family)